MKGGREVAEKEKQGRYSLDYPPTGLSAHKCLRIDLQSSACRLEEETQMDTLFYTEIPLWSCLEIISTQAVRGTGKRSVKQGRLVLVKFCECLTIGNLYFRKQCL